MRKLTELELRALAPDQVGKTLYDAGGLRGEIRLGEGGAVVSFSYRYRFDGKSREVRCGTWPHASLKAIRSTRDWARDSVRRGTDPALARHQVRAEQMKAQREAASAIDAMYSRPTLRQVFEEWHRREISKRTDGGKEIRRSRRMCFPRSAEFPRRRSPGDT